MNLYRTLSHTSFASGDVRRTDYEPVVATRIPAVKMSESMRYVGSLAGHKGESLLSSNYICTDILVCRLGHCDRDLKRVPRHHLNRLSWSVPKRHRQMWAHVDVFLVDKTIIVWQLTRDDSQYGYPKRILHGHNHFVSDIVISSDGQFALSSSWDHTLRLWDLNTGLTTRRFIGHTSDVLSVSFSADNRQIVSGSRDRTIKLWNTLGECKFDIKEEGHSEW